MTAPSTRSVSASGGASDPVREAGAPADTGWRLDPVVVHPGVQRNLPAPGTRVPHVVVGSGPGGLITATLLAEAGREVLLLEDGPLLPLEACTPFSASEMVLKYRAGGLTAAMGRPNVNYVEARCVGGGSEINSGLYHRLPPVIAARWARDFGTEGLGEADLLPHQETVERDVCVSLLPAGEAPEASLRLHEGALALGWQSLEVPRWFRHDHAPEAGHPATSENGRGSGNAGSAGGGAARGRKSRGTRCSMTKTYLPRFLAAGGKLLPGVRVSRLQPGPDGGVRVLGRASDGRATGAELDLAAGHVFCAAGAVQTPALLRRSGITHNVGDRFALHPTVKVVARFDRPVNEAGMGVPVHQVKQFAPRFSFGCSISSPEFLALALAEQPGGDAVVRRHWTHMAVYYAMTTAEPPGSVRPLPGLADPLVSYALRERDLAELAEALRRLCQCLRAAGAVELWPSIAGYGGFDPRVTGRGSGIDALPEVLPATGTRLMTIHLFGSTPAGADRRVTAADSWGAVHDVRGLHLADAGMICTPPCVNPQGTLMSLVRRNTLRFLGA